MLFQLLSKIMQAKRGFPWWVHIDEQKSPKSQGRTFSRIFGAFFHFSTNQVFSAGQYNITCGIFSCFWIKKVCDFASKEDYHFILSELTWKMDWISLRAKEKHILGFLDGGSLDTNSGKIDHLKQLFSKLTDSGNSLLSPFEPTRISQISLSHKLTRFCRLSNH